MSKQLLNATVKSQLISRFLNKKTADDAGASMPDRKAAVSNVPEQFYRFDRHPEYEKMQVPKAAAARLKLANPFFHTHEGVAGAKTFIDGREYINFSSYNYLGLCGHPQVSKAAKDAIDRYGTSASASRLVAGERPVQRALEESLAECYGVDDCVVFVSGHATNVTTIGYLFGSRDLILHDALIHNSVLEGIQLSGSTRRSFPHNDLQALEAILAEIRGQFERVLIVVEGLYSMDGDMADLPALVDIKQRYKAFLMVDEAHALGVLGATGRGSHEHYGIDGRQVDIWMGTLSKTLAAAGGYIAGESALIEHLKYAAPGFVYSVGIAPPMAAAALKALELMLAEPDRVRRLQYNGQFFLHTAREHGVDTGLSQGYAVTPAILQGSLKAVKCSNALFEHGFNAQPIVYPAVEEKVARVRFFISSLHTEQQMTQLMTTLESLL